MSKSQLYFRAASLLAIGLTTCVGSAPGFAQTGTSSKSKPGKRQTIVIFDARDPYGLTGNLPPVRHDTSLELLILNPNSFKERYDLSVKTSNFHNVSLPDPLNKFIAKAEVETGDLTVQNLPALPFDQSGVDTQREVGLPPALKVAYDRYVNAYERFIRVASGDPNFAKKAAVLKKALKSTGIPDVSIGDALWNSANTGSSNQAIQRDVAEITKGYFDSFQGMGRPLTKSEKDLIDASCKADNDQLNEAKMAAHIVASSPPPAISASFGNTSDVLNQFLIDVTAPIAPAVPVPGSSKIYLPDVKASVQDRLIDYPVPIDQKNKRYQLRPGAQTAMLSLADLFPKPAKDASAELTEAYEAMVKEKENFSNLSLLYFDVYQSGAYLRLDYAVDPKTGVVTNRDLLSKGYIDSLNAAQLAQFADAIKILTPGYTPSAPTAGRTLVGLQQDLRAALDVYVRSLAESSRAAQQDIATQQAASIGVLTAQIELLNAGAAWESALDKPFSPPPTKPTAPVAPVIAKITTYRAAFEVFERTFYEALFISQEFKTTFARRLRDAAYEDPTTPDAKEAATQAKNVRDLRAAIAPKVAKLQKDIDDKAKKVKEIDARVRRSPTNRDLVQAQKNANVALGNARQALQQVREPLVNAEYNLRRLVFAALQREQYSLVKTYQELVKRRDDRTKEVNDGRKKQFDETAAALKKTGDLFSMVFDPRRTPVVQILATEPVVDVDRIDASLVVSPIAPLDRDKIAEAQGAAAPPPTSVAVSGRSFHWSQNVVGRPVLDVGLGLIATGQQNASDGASSFYLEDTAFSGKIPRRNGSQSAYLVPSAFLYTYRTSDKHLPGPLRGLGTYSCGWGLGATVEETPRYMIGPALVFGHANRVGLVGGLLLGQKAELSGGQRLGELTSATSISTRKVWRGDWFVGVTFTLTSIK